MSRTIQPGQLKRVLLVSFSMPGQYSMAPSLLKGYAEADVTVHGQVAIRTLDIALTGRHGPLGRLLGEVLSWRPQLIGFSCCIWSATTIRRACRWLRRLLPRTVLLLGGQEICPPIDEVTADYPEADILIEGEGERPFRDLLRTLVEKGTDGMPEAAGLHVRSHDGSWRQTDPVERVADLESIPSPYLSGDLLPPRDAYFGAMIEITRGCPNQCAFCFEARRYRTPESFPLERVEHEIRFLLDKGVRRFHFLDPILYHGGRLAAIHEMLARLPLEDVSFFVELYAERVKPDDLQYLDFVGACDIGIQTISDEASRIIKRPFRKERFLEGYSLLREAGKRINLQLIIGLPGDTLAGFRAGAKFALDLQSETVIFNRLNVLRGTPLRLDADRYALKYDAEPPYHVRECDTFPAGDIEEAIAFRDRVTRTFFPSVEY